MELLSKSEILLWIILICAVIVSYSIGYSNGYHDCATFVIETIKNYSST